MSRNSRFNTQSESGETADGGSGGVGGTTIGNLMSGGNAFAERTCGGAPVGGLAGGGGGGGGVWLAKLLRRSFSLAAAGSEEEVQAAWRLSRCRMAWRP